MKKWITIAELVELEPIWLMTEYIRRLALKKPRSYRCILSKYPFLEDIIQIGETPSSYEEANFSMPLVEPDLENDRDVMTKGK